MKSLHRSLLISANAGLHPNQITEPGSSSARQNRSPDHSARGAAMVFALIALLIASMIIGSLMRTASRSHRQLKRDEYRLQASFLADAGCDRAQLLLQQNPDFQSGEWQIPAGRLAPGRAAIVQMSVTTDPDHPEERIIAAVARYPIDHRDLVRITRQIRIPK